MTEMSIVQTLLILVAWWRFQCLTRNNTLKTSLLLIYDFFLFEKIKKKNCCERTKNRVENKNTIDLFRFALKRSNMFDIK